VTDVDIPTVLRALAEQQTALLAAHAESMRMQRVLIEQLTLQFHYVGAAFIDALRQSSTMACWAPGGFGTAVCTCAEK
jgi:methylmalonyl-CoA mutase cobalamin-binding subunit